MAKPKVFVTRKIPEIGMAMLRKKCEVRTYPIENRPVPRKELIKGIKWADAVLSVLSEKIDAEIMDVNPKLRIIANYAVGFDNIDLKAATKRGIPVTNTPSLLVTDAVSEHTFALILTIARRIVESDKYLRAGKYKLWGPKLFLGTALHDKTLGVLGMGRIGKGVVRRAGSCMKMNIIYHDVVRDKAFEREYNAKFVSKETLLKQSDFITLHVPLLKSTHHFIGAKELKMMKKTACIINTARGPVIDEKALVAALRKKEIAGAGLDVFEFEPKLTPGLAKLDNVILTPHTASATHEARSEMAEMAAKNVLAAVQGKRPPHLVNKEVY